MESIQTTKLLNLSLKSNTIFTNLLVLAFLFFGLIGILNHEMWLDELQSWMIARDSSSISDLFNNLRYEGHPALWHVCLYFISRFIRNPIAMQLFHLLLATAVIYIFTKFSPFTELQKFLFAFGYFPFYEYNIISRNYSLGVLLIFLFCRFFPHRNQSYILLSIILSLLANTNVYGWIIAICLAVTLLFEKIIDRSINRLFFTRRWDLIISIIIFIVSIAIALFQIIPPSDRGYKGDSEEVFTQSSLPLINVGRLALTLTTIWTSYIPIPNLFEYKFWGTNILTEGPAILKICALLVSLRLLYFSIAIFIQKPVALFLYLSGTFSILLFSYAKYFGSLRHHGHLFILFVACIWISNYYTTDNFSRRFKALTKLFRYQKHYLTIILLIHVFVGFFAFSMDLSKPFSASKEVASFIESHSLNDTLIVSRDFAGAPVAALLDKKIYYLDSDNFGSFIVWNKIRDNVNFQEIQDKINNLITPKDLNALLILSYEFAPDNKRPDLKISELSKFSKSIVFYEDYHLYLIRKKPLQ